MRKQLELNIYKGQNGGRRPGSGRKRVKSKGVAHKPREPITSKTPLHINFKYRMTIRSDYFRKILERAIENALQKDLYITHYTIQSNHVHLIAEASNNHALSSGMKSLTTTIVRLLNKGSIQIERYHLHVLRTQAETDYALEYVLLNDLKHTGRLDKRFTKTIGTGKSWLLIKANELLLH